jgi:MFS family permease
MMIAGVFTASVPIYAFYAMQPYLLELYGRNEYRFAGAAAALVAASQIAGGLTVPWARRLYGRRAPALLVLTLASAAALLAIGCIRLWVVLTLLAAWALGFAAATPIRQAYLDRLIPSEQRATVLSSDNMLGSLGGALAQPGLGSVAQARGYSASYVAAAAVELLAVPFLLLAAARERRSEGKEVTER